MLTRKMKISELARSALAFSRRNRKTCEILLMPWVLLGILAVLWGKLLDGKHSFSAFQDNVFLNHPLFYFISHTFSSGERPYWINSIMGGFPIYTNPLISIFYPFYFFHFGLYQSPLEVITQLHYVVLFHIVILYFNFYILLRILRLSILSSLLGATIFALSANTFSYAYWVDIISPYAWFPLAIGSLVLLLESEDSKSGYFLGIISYTLLTLASPTQPLIHVVYCTAFLLICFQLHHWRNRNLRVRAVWRLSLLTLIVILLAAPALIPPLLTRGDSIRWMGNLPPVIGYQRLSIEALSEFQFSVRELANVFFPNRIVRVIGNSYFGIIPAFLVVFALFAPHRRWILFPFLGLGLYTLLSSTGKHLGFVYLNSLLPLWNLIREPGRHFFIFLLAFSALSAFGFDYLVEYTKRSSFFAVKKHLIALAAFCALLCLSYIFRADIVPFIPPSRLILFFVLFIVALLALGYLPSRCGRISSVLLAVMAMWPIHFFPYQPPKIEEISYFNPFNLRSHRVLEQISKIPDVGDYRLIIEDDQLNVQYWSMNAIYHGVRNFGLFFNPAPYHQFQAMSSPHVNENYFKLLGGKYYLCRKCDVTLKSDYTIEKEIEGYKLYSTSKALPRYFFARSIARTYTSDKDFHKKIELNDDYLQKVYVRAEDLGIVSSWLQNQDAEIETHVIKESASINTLKLQLRTNCRSLLVLNEYFGFNKEWEFSLRNWHVSVNGKEQDPIKVNLCQLGVLLPEGLVEVQFEYRPRLLIGLMWLQGGALVSLLVYSVAIAFRRFNRPNSAPARDIG